MTVQGSFRDPAGRLYDQGGRILRVVTDSKAAADLPAILRLEPIQRAVARKTFVATRILEVLEHDALRLPASLESAPLVLEHERIPFPSYPYEWPPEMLHAAGRLTLDLTLALLRKGYGLKDATPYNVLYSGPRPVFVDVLSVERREPGDYTWLAQAQFERTFLLPLLAAKVFGLRLDGPLMTRREGLEPTDVYSLASPWRRLLPPFLGLVSLPTWLSRAGESRGASLYRARRDHDPERAEFILSGQLHRLSAVLERLTPGRRHSTWSGYMESERSYSSAAFQQKEAFLRRVLEERPVESLLDIGCHTGHFSLLSARHGAASALAIDSDPAVVGETWRRAAAEGLPVLPLVVDFARPSPSTGWMNDECPSFLDRARGRFDLVLLLAVVHHLVVTERIPLEAVVDAVAQIATGRVIVEYVGPSDPCFRRIARGRDALYQHATRAAFEAAFGRRFRVIRSEPLTGCERQIYLLERSTESVVHPSR